MYFGFRSSRKCCSGETASATSVPARQPARDKRAMGALFSKKKKYWVPEHRKLADLCDDPQRC